jgi:hypothetical protein
MGPRPRIWKRRAAEALSKSHNFDTFERLPGQRFYALHREAVACRTGEEWTRSRSTWTSGRLTHKVAPVFPALRILPPTKPLHLIQKCSTVRDSDALFFWQGLEPCLSLKGDE